MDLNQLLNTVLNLHELHKKPYTSKNFKAGFIISHVPTEISLRRFIVPIMDSEIRVMYVHFILNFYCRLFCRIYGQK